MCISSKGSLYEISSQNFELLKVDQKAWSVAMKDAIRKLNWAYGDFITSMKSNATLLENQNLTDQLTKDSQANLRDS